jgi:hypothetical protein
MHLKLDIARVGSDSRRIPHNMSNMRMHYMAKSRWTKEWKRLVEEAFLEQATLPRPRYDKSTVVVKFYAIPQFDCDGAYHAAKPVIDGLTNSGIIVDDSQDHIDLKVEQIKVNKKCDERVEIDIIPL